MPRRTVRRIGSLAVGAVVLAGCGIGPAPAAGTRARPAAAPVTRHPRTAAPVVTGYQPTVVAPGGTLTIRGVGFGSTPGSVTVCQFCGTPSALTATANVLAWRPTVVRVVVPGLQNGTATVTLTTADGHRVRVGTIWTGVSPPTGRASAPSPSGAPVLTAVFLDYPPSPDGSMPASLVVGLNGRALGSTPTADSVTVNTPAGQLLALATEGGVSRHARVESWTPTAIVVSLDQPWTGHLVVTVHTRHGSAAWTVGLPTGVWRPFRVWSTAPAVAAEYFPPGSPEPSLASLNAEAAQGTFPSSAAAAEHALPGGVADPVQLWPVAGAGHWFLWQPTHLVDGTVPAGAYLVYTGRSFPDPLTGHFAWVTVPAAVGGPAAFQDAAKLQVFARCQAPLGTTPPCP